MSFLGQAGSEVLVEGSSLFGQATRGGEDQGSEGRMLYLEDPLLVGSFFKLFRACGSRMGAGSFCWRERAG